MPKQLPDFLQFVINDCMVDIPGVTYRAMFGGWGIYKDGVIFAIADDEQIYLKVGESNKEQYVKKGSKPFEYEQGNHKHTTMSYYELPADILEDKEELAHWVEQSVQVSRATKKK